MKGRWCAVLGAGAIVVAGAAAAQSGDILQKAINTPAVAYSFYGPGQTSKPVKADVAGGHALQVTIEAPGATVWQVGASSPIAKPIAKGDKIVVAFWARAPKLAADATTPIPFAGVSLAAAPYTPLVTGSAAVGRDWKLHQVTGVAASDAAGGAAMVSLHLGAAKAVLEFGPIFVIDLGKAGAPAASPS
ncbi:hypothetical protein LPN01_06935 [Sphingomonas sp. A2-49]|uniref:hypothetical protein n=1 Tax=Sphingomonas sp. A2-49 TaxID=1391375 RepID=UPI0021D1A85D|nr:hypothetical protein [Sphingomonas sp. A2-49]MCU6453808.1 hypothetical protein [Sphingomonas sp. A2-49]